MSEDRKTIIVASRVHTSFVMNEPPPKDYDSLRDKPLRSHIIHGARHPAAAGEVGITEGVDPELFHKWIDAPFNKGAKDGNLVYEVSPDDVKKLRAGVIESGFEPGLERAKADAAKASEGSTNQGDAPVTAEDMAARSDTPNDDSPRSQTGQPAGTGI